MRTILKDWYWRSGGAAQAFDSPAPLLLAPVSTTQIDAYWMDVGGGDVEVEIHDADDFSNLIASDSGNINLKQFTGLTINTTYYARVRLVGATEWVTSSAKTFSKDVAAFYSGIGAGTATDNDWADTTSSVVDTLKSYFGSGPDFTKGLSPEVSALENRYSGSCIKTANSYFDAATPITLSGTVRQIAFRIHGGIGGAVEAFMGRKAGDYNNLLWMGASNAKIDIRLSSATTYSVDLPATMDAQQVYDVVVKVDGNQARCSLDGGATYGTAKTANTNDWVIDRLFADAGGGNRFSSFIESVLFYAGSTEMTAAEIAEYFDMKCFSTYTPSSADTDPKFTGSWRTPTNGYVDDITSVADNGTRHRINSLNIYGNIVAMMSNKKVSEFSDGLLTLIDGANNNISTAKVLQHYVESADEHTHPSLSMFDGRILSVRHNEWYGIISYNTLKIRSSGKNFNITEFTELPIGKNLPVYEFANCGYENIYHISGRSLLVQQEFTTWQRYLKVAVSYDGCLSYPDVNRLIDAGTSANRLYFIPIWNGSLNTFYILWQDLLASGGAYQRCGVIKSTDGITWSNFYGTWSFNAATAGVQTLSTINTNSGVVDVSGGTLKNAPIGNAAVKSDGTVYFIRGGGENTNWYITESDNSSAWYNMLITISGVSNVLVAPGAGDNNRYEPIVYHDGIYKCLMLVDPNLDGLYRVGLFHQTAIDKVGGTITMTFQGYVSDDDTKKHWHLIAPADYEFANVAYVKGTVVDGADGYTWKYKIKG